MLVHSGERPYKCTVCGQSFTTNGNMHRWVMAAGAGGWVWRLTEWPKAIMSSEFCSLYGKARSRSGCAYCLLCSRGVSLWETERPGQLFGPLGIRVKQSPSPFASRSFFVWVPEVGSSSDNRGTLKEQHGNPGLFETTCICHRSFPCKNFLGPLNK